MVEVIVAEPNSLLRIGMRSVLEQYEDVAIAAEVVDAGQLVAAMRGARYDVVLVGLGLLRDIGAVAFRECRQQNAGCGILVHSYEWDGDFGAEASQYGATGYFSHECSAVDLHAAVLDVAAGRPFVTQGLDDAVAAAACFRADERHLARLSARERKLFMMYTIGMTQHNISAQTGLPVQDLIQYKRRIMAKVDMSGASVLVRHAIAQAYRARFLAATTPEHTGS